MNTELRKCLQFFLSDSRLLRIEPIDPILVNVALLFSVLRFEESAHALTLAIDCSASGSDGCGQSRLIDSIAEGNYCKRVTWCDFVALTRHRRTVTITFD